MSPKTCLDCPATIGRLTMNDRCPACRKAHTATRKAAEKFMAREKLTVDRADGAFVVRGEAGNILLSGYKTYTALCADLAQ